MGRTIILPIQSKFVKEIISGKKRYEFRRNFPRDAISKILIYESAPVSKIVAEATVEQIQIPVSRIMETIDIDELTSSYLPEYYSGRGIAYVYRIKKLTTYDKPKFLSEFGFTSAPQNFFYI